MLSIALLEESYWQPRNLLNRVKDFQDFFLSHFVLTVKIPVQFQQALRRKWRARSLPHSSVFVWKPEFLCLYLRLRPSPVPKSIFRTTVMPGTSVQLSSRAYIKRASLTHQWTSIPRAKINPRYVHSFLPDSVCATRLLPCFRFPVDRCLTLLWTPDHLAGVSELYSALQVFKHHCIPNLLWDSQ